MKQFTPQQTKQVNALVRAECCNFFQGNCDALDVGEAVPCPQIASQSMLCLWFQKAVLPIDKVLCAELAPPDTQKHCVRCGGVFLSSSHSVKYCRACARKVRREQQAKFAREKRAKASTSKAKKSL